MATQRRDQDTSLVNVLLALADGLLKMDKSMQLFMDQTARRFEGIEARLTAFETQNTAHIRTHEQNNAGPRSSFISPHVSPVTPNHKGSSNPTIPSPTRQSSAKEADRQLKDALVGLELQLSHLQRPKNPTGNMGGCGGGGGSHRQHKSLVDNYFNVAPSCLSAESSSVSNVETGLSSAADDDASAGSNQRPSGLNQMTPSSASGAGSKTPTESVSQWCPRHSPPPKAHSPVGVRAVRLAGGNHEARSSSRLVSQPRTEACIGVDRGTSVDDLLRMAMTKSVPLAHHRDSELGASLPRHNPQEGKLGVERWLSTLSDNGSDPLLVSKSTQ